MTKTEKVRNFLLKLQSLPDNKKKIILWTIVAVLAIIMGFFWVRGAINTFSKIAESTKSLSIPFLDTSGAPDMPTLDVLQTVTPSDESIK